MRILIAGLGNIFFGDDAFGVEVVRELMRRDPPPEAHVEDFGIRSYDLAYAMMDGYDATILVDAAQRGQPPGTLYLIQPDPAGAAEAPDAHSMNPEAALRMVKTLGGEPSRMLYLVACEPENVAPDDCQLGLSDSVQAAIPGAADMVEELVRDLLKENPIPAKGGETHAVLQQ